MPRKMRFYEEALGVKAVPTVLAGSTLISPFAAANSNGIILTSLALDEEVEQIRKSLPEIRVTVLNSRLTAIGNLVLCNDHGAILSPALSRGEVRQIEETLGVEVVKAEIASRSYVGSVAVATNGGALVHVDMEEEDAQLIRDVLKVEPSPGTVNDGVKFVRSGVLANTRGAIVGSRTTGPELLAISRAFGP